MGVADVAVPLSIPVKALERDCAPLTLPGGPAKCEMAVGLGLTECSNASRRLCCDPSVSDVC
jgi:hypothetical protein